MLRKNKVTKLMILLIAIIQCVLVNGCSQKLSQKRSMILATTTSTEDSGLLEYILPKFKEDTGIDVEVVAKGTGEALEIGKRGDADCLLVHAKEKELKFVEEGYGKERLEVMYNDFVLIGPKDDPLSIKNKASKDIIGAMKMISSNKYPFISRGDDSGTNTKELNLWKEAGVQPSGDWYISAGSGMSKSIQMADEKKAYILTDRATFLSMHDKIDMDIVTEGDKSLFNQYALIRLNDDEFDIKSKEANEFIDWMTSEKGQNIIGEFGKEEYGQALFVPNAE